MNSLGSSEQTESPASGDASPAEPQQPSEAIEIPKPKWRAGAVTLFLGFVLVVGLGAWAGYAIWNQGLQNQLDAEIAKIRERGEPVWFAELRPEPVPDAENGLADFWIACRLYRETQMEAGRQKTSPTWIYVNNEASGAYGDYTQLTPGQIAECRGMLDENAEMFARLRAALKKPIIQISYDYDTDCPPAILLGEIQSSREICRLLRVETFVAHAEHDLDSATSAICDQLRLNLALRAEPFLISHLVRMANMNEAFAALQTVLGAGPINDERFRELDQLLADLEPTFSLRDAMLAERAMLMSTANMATSDSLMLVADDTSSFERWAYANVAALRMRDQLALLKIRSEGIDLIDNPAQEAAARLEEIEAEVDQADSWSMLGNQVMSTASARQRALSASQQCLNARIALRIARHYHQTGQLPATLAEITDDVLPEIPIGLISQQPLAYDVNFDDESGVGFELLDTGSTVTFKVQFTK